MDIARRELLAADAAPQHVALGGAVAYVASGDDGTLRAHRLDDGRRMWTAAVPAGSYNVTTGGRSGRDALPFAGHPVGGSSR